jgi:peptidoglycan biosynthesis protein MviN/MurJ (putative lipid II flippase)
MAAVRGPLPGQLTGSRGGGDNPAMVGAGAVCVLFGVWILVAAIRPHPGSEAGSLTGGSRVFVRLMGIATGVWLIAVAVALFGHDLHALLGIIEAFSVLYIVVAVVWMLAALAGGRGGVGSAHRRDPGLRPEKPSPRPPGSIHYR